MPDPMAKRAANTAKITSAIRVKKFPEPNNNSNRIKAVSREEKNKWTLPAGEKEIDCLTKKWQPPLFRPCLAQDLCIAKLPARPIKNARGKRTGCADTENGNIALNGTKIQSEYLQVQCLLNDCSWPDFFENSHCNQ